MILTLTCSYCARQFERQAHKVYAKGNARYFCNDICRKLGIKNTEEKIKQPPANNSINFQEECEECGRKYDINKKSCPYCGTANIERLRTKHF